VGGAFRKSGYSPCGNTGRAPTAFGVIGEIARQGEPEQAATADTCDPAADDELDEDQVEACISLIQKTRHNPGGIHGENAEVIGGYGSG